MTVPPGHRVLALVLGQGLTVGAVDRVTTGAPHRGGMPATGGRTVSGVTSCAPTAIVVPEEAGALSAAGTCGDPGSSSVATIGAAVRTEGDRETATAAVSRVDLEDPAVPTVIVLGACNVLPRGSVRAATGGTSGRTAPVRTARDGATTAGADKAVRGPIMAASVGVRRGEMVAGPRVRQTAAAVRTATTAHAPATTDVPGATRAGASATTAGRAVTTADRTATIGVNGAMTADLPGPAVVLVPMAAVRAEPAAGRVRATVDRTAIVTTGRAARTGAPGVANVRASATAPGLQALASVRGRGTPSSTAIRSVLGPSVRVTMTRTSPRASSPVISTSRRAPS